MSIMNNVSEILSSFHLPHDLATEYIERKTLGGFEVTRRQGDTVILITIMIKITFTF